MKILTLSDVGDSVNIDLTPVRMILKELDNNIDTVIFAGDVNTKNSDEFFNILSARFSQIIWVAGNHDFYDDEEESLSERPLSTAEKEFTMKKYSDSILSKHNNIQLLYPTGYIKIDKIIIAGISFGCDISSEFRQILKSKYKRILVTHEPPHGILDISYKMLNKDENENPTGHFGNKEILELVNECAPNLHIFGHAHHSGQRKQYRDTLFNTNGTLFVNVAWTSRMSYDKTTYTGVYGILDTNKMDIELKCLNSKKIICEKCKRTAYIPIKNKNTCYNCRKITSIDPDTHMFNIVKNKPKASVIENKDGTTSVTYTEKIDGLGTLKTTQTFNLNRDSKSKKISKENQPSLFDF